MRHNLPILLAIFLSACTVEPIVSNMGYAVNASGDHFKSWKELNDQSVVMQQYDYSCGAAALATIMKYYFQDDVTEKSLLDYIKATLTAEEYAVVEEHGLSFLELEKISHSLGYQSASVRLQLSALKELAGLLLSMSAPRITNISRCSVVSGKTGYFWQTQAVAT
nr:cysteine peptidase family C39 domain-containing protein [Thiothrix subterranea]